VRERLRGRRSVTVEELGRTLQEVLRERSLPEDAAGPPGGSAIRVTMPSGEAPFSKGFLSQSLLAAAIEPNDAFDVAREIEGQLLLRGTREIDRRDLRRLAFQTLERRFGARTAERYLVWRRYQDPDRPVILLLGGATGSGKTSLALEVGHRLGIHRVMSTDAIRQIMRLMLSADLVPAIHASSYDAHQVLGPSEDAVIDGFLAQASIVSVGVRAMLERAVAENASQILDGVSIVPGLLDLAAYAETAHVIFLVVATLDERAFRARFEQRARTSHRPEHRYLEHFDAILRIQDHFLELADRHDIPIVDNESIDGSVLSIIKHVTETLRKEGGFDAEEMLA
jgi:2-phosphoglycerate kinase